MPPTGGFFRVCPIQGCSLTRLLLMAIQVISANDPIAADWVAANCVAANRTQSSMEILSKNTLTTAGVMVAAGTGIAGAAVLAAALPAQIATATAISGGLIYAGDRQAKGLPVNPFNKGTDTAASTPEAAA